MWFKVAVWANVDHDLTKCTLVRRAYSTTRCLLGSTGLDLVCGGKNMKYDRERTCVVARRSKVLVE